MIAVGIATFNEAENLAALVKKIDAYAITIGEPVTIINCDNSSPDGTAKIFQGIKTTNPKISLSTSQTGKGRNVRTILECVVKLGFTYCMLIDGDVTSLERSWLESHVAAAKLNIDFVVPNYSRYMHEGNTTNHLLYPLLFYLTAGNVPRQPIAGDFGIARAFALYLCSLPWSGATLRYGVDVFMTMQALFGSFTVQEIALPKKIHKPSFEKMIGIATDEMESYYQARAVLQSTQPIRFTPSTTDWTLLDSPGIDDYKLQARRTEAKELQIISGTPFSDQYPKLPEKLSATEWADILLLHEQHVGDYSANMLARSICPFYLIRVVTYLESIRNAADAVSSINDQTAIIKKTLGSLRHPLHQRPRISK
ncbi:MAG TPA: glycosyltransferase [Candidatus Dormibacteraeota bacterium]|nr:glycosyltransferase [Candidatus Dormibacteraeota bacterium]